MSSMGAFIFPERGLGTTVKNNIYYMAILENECKNNSWSVSIAIQLFYIKHS